MEDQEVYVIQLQGEMGQPNSSHLSVNTFQEDGDTMVFVEHATYGPKGGRSARIIEILKEHFLELAEYVRKEENEHE